jgi:hypothetical protein
MDDGKGSTFPLPFTAALKMPPSVGLGLPSFLACVTFPLLLPPLQYFEQFIFGNRFHAQPSLRDAETS